MDFLRTLQILRITAQSKQLTKTLCIRLDALIHQFYSFLQFPFMAQPLQVNNGSNRSSRSLQRLNRLLRSPLVRVLVLWSPLIRVPGLWIPQILILPLIRALPLGVRIPLPGITPLLGITLSTSLSQPLPLVRVILTLIWISTAAKIRSLIRISSSGIALIWLSLITILIAAHGLGLRAPLRARTLRGPLVRVPLLMVLIWHGRGTQGLSEM